MLRQVESGDQVADICRKVGISRATYYLWKRQYAGLGVSELRELRQLREENGRRVATPMATGADQCWSRDFVSDQLADGRSFRILTVVDQFTRECVWLEADRSMTGMKVAQALERAKCERGSLPDSITVDNGSEFCSRALEAWAMGHDVQLCFIRQEGRWRTDSSKASTADCGTSV